MAAVVNEVRSLYRRVRLATPPPEETTVQVLYVPTGSTDQEVLGWAAEVLDPASLEELRTVIERDAAAAAVGRPAGSTTQPSPGAGAR